MEMKKAELKFTFLEVVVMGFMVLLLIGAAYKFFWEPAKGTFTPIFSNIEADSGQVGKVSEDVDMDSDGVPDQVDECCSCERIGPADVSPNTGCAEGQAKAVCITPCGLGVV